MIVNQYNAFALKPRLTRYGGVGSAYQAGSVVSRAADESRGALAVWEGEGGRIAPPPAVIARA